MDGLNRPICWEWSLDFAGWTVHRNRQYWLIRPKIMVKSLLANKWCRLSNCTAWYCLIHYFRCSLWGWRDKAVHYAPELALRYFIFLLQKHGGNGEMWHLFSVRKNKQQCMLYHIPDPSRAGCHKTRKKSEFTHLRRDLLRVYSKMVCTECSPSLSNPSYCYQPGCTYGIPRKRLNMLQCWSCQGWVAISVRLFCSALGQWK